jgi:two-component system phosphate regulon sensor histidine kinase PhoR
LISSSERKRSLTQLKESMISQTQLLSSIFSSCLSEEPPLAQIDSLADELGHKIGGRITIVDRTGRVLGDTDKSGQELLNMENHKERPEVAQAFEGKVEESTRYSATLKMDMLYIAYPIETQGEIIGVARLALPLTELKYLQNRIVKIVILGLLVAFVFSLVLTYGFSTRVTRPLCQMMRIGEKMSQGDFSQKVMLKSRDEIGELGEIINQISAELSHKIAQITQDKSQLQSILSSMVEGVLAVDSSGKVLFFNSALSQTFDLDTSFYGKPYYEIIRNHELNEFIREILSTREEKRKEITFIHPVERDFMIQPALVEKQRGGDFFALFVFHDISELKKTEKIRRDFVANVSHELRTPLTSIQGFVEALKDGAIKDEEKSRRFLSIISQHTRRMNEIISDLLKLSQIESKDFVLKPEPFSLKELFEEVLFVLKPSADKKSQVIEISLDNENQKVSGDRYRINQALTNLLDNAIKYTPEKGKIKLESRDKGDCVEIAVIDNGVGIPLNDVPRIFERFYRVDKGRSKELGGTGLGLSIVKHIIEAHGSKVEVKSQLGQGSEFSFCLRKA